MDLNKFTERARGFVQAAQTIAMREGHQRMMPEHLLKALMDDEQGLASNLIYFGTIAQPVNYLFHSYFMYTYLRDLEENVFERKSDLVYLFIFAAAMMEVREHPALLPRCPNSS